MAGYFPLSQRPRRDESSVSNNWARHTGTVLLELTGVLDALEPSDWQTPSLRPALTVRDVVAELVWLASTTRWQRLLTPSARSAGEPAAVEPAALTARVRELATAALAPSATRTVAHLSHAVVAAYEVARATRHPLAIDPLASGAVALARGLGGPIGARAVTRERTLVATDAEWSVGRGPAIEGTAEAIVLFLFQRGTLGG